MYPDAACPVRQLDAAWMLFLYCSCGRETILVDSATAGKSMELHGFQASSALPRAFYTYGHRMT